MHLTFKDTNLAYFCNHRMHSIKGCTIIICIYFVSSKRAFKSSPTRNLQQYAREDFWQKTNMIFKSQKQNLNSKYVGRILNPISCIT